MKTKKKPILLIAVIFSCMIAISIAENAKGIFIPAFKERFHIDDADIGLVLLLASFAYMAGSYMAGFLIDRIQRKKSMLLGVALLLSGTLMLSYFKSLFTFYLSFVISNIGMAFMGLSVNTLIPSLKVKNSAVLMNLVHFFYGIGATATHKSFGRLISKGYDFSQIYVILILFSALLFFSILLVRFGALESKSDTVTYKFNPEEKKLLFLFGIALGLYISAEIQTGNWIIDYIKNSYQYSEDRASNFSSLFFLFFTFGRLFGGYLAERIGYMKSVIISCFLGGSLYLTGLLLESKGLVLLSISGIFFSIVFPVLMLSAGLYFKEKLNRASGIIVSIASGTNMLMGFIIGYSAKLVHINYAMYWIPLFLFSGTALIILTKKKGDSLLKE